MRLRRLYFNEENSSRWMGVLFVLSLFVWCVPARGQGNLGPMNEIGTGPAVAYVYGSENGVSVNWDTSISWSLFTASVNLKLNHFPDGNISYGGPQAEFTLWAFVNVGGGVGYLWGDLSGPVLHTFVGIPLGDDWLPAFFEPFNSIYFEPYVRCNFFFPDDYQFNVEAGLMIKMTTWAI